MSTNHAILEQIDHKLPSSNIVLVSKDILPKDINEFKESVQQLVTASIIENNWVNMHTNQESKFDDIYDPSHPYEIGEQIPSPLSPPFERTSPSQPIRLAKKLRLRQIGRSKRILTRKLVDMGVIRTRPQTDKCFFF